MRHLTEDELILYHYNEGRRHARVDEHLQECSACAASYRAIVETLSLVPDPEVPERDDRYGLEVWQRIRHSLPVQNAPWWIAWYRPALAGAVAVLIVAAFVAGRYWPAAQPTPAVITRATDVPPDASDRVRLAAISDHLEQSERVLLDLVNAGGQQIDVREQQAWAVDLIDANRLYRHEAERAGDDTVASVLDELERQLLEIVHGPSTLTPAELETVRARLDAAALLFKVRILSDELRDRELAPPQKRTWRPPSGGQNVGPTFRSGDDKRRERPMQITKHHLIRATFVALIVAGCAASTNAQSRRTLPVPPTPPTPIAPIAPDAPPAPLAPMAPPSPLALPALAPLPPLPPFDWNIDIPFPDINIDLSALSDRLADLRLDLPFPQAAPKPAPQPAPPRPAAFMRNPSSAELLYERAMSYLDGAQYERALDQFDRLIQLFDQGGTTAIANKVDGAYYWKAYTEIKQKRITDALSTLETMQKKFADSRWLKDAKTLELEARQSSGQSVSPDAQSDEELKLLALRGLMQSDPDRGLPMIEQLLAGTSSVKVKQNALFVLSQSRSPRARDVITNVAKGGGNPDLQLRAVRYLGAMGGPDNRQILQDVYRSTSDVSIKRAVIRSYVPSGDRERLLAIAKSEQNVELRGEAIRQLGAMRATTELSDLYTSESSPELKKTIMQSLFSGGASDKLMELARTEKDPELRRSAIRNLGAMNAARTGDTLKALYSSEQSPENKREIVNALFAQRNAAALVDLARAEKDPALKRDIVSRLSTMREKVATDYLIELLK